MFRTLAASFIVAWSLSYSAKAALITSHIDSDFSSATPDGTISADEYGLGNAFSYTGGGAGFGGQLGPATMYMKGDSDNLYIGLSNLGVHTDGNMYIIYLHTRSGGFQPNGEMDDFSDAGRTAISRLSSLGTENITFDDGAAQAPDYAIIINNRAGGFVATFELQGTGNTHNYFDITWTGLNSSTMEFAISNSSISVSAGSIIDVTAVEVSDTEFLSNEGIPDPGLVSNPGFNDGNTTTFDDFHRFQLASSNSGIMTNRVNASSLNLPSVPPGTSTSSYSTVNAFPSLNFSAPTCIRTPPGETNRLFVAQQGGSIIVVTNLATPGSSVFMDIGSRLIAFGGSGESGLLGFDFHPDYASNGYFYVFYTASGGGHENRVARYQVSGDPNIANTNSELILISQHDDCSNHNGGDVHFGPDGYLYVSLGDEGGSNDNCDNNGQRIDKDFFSSVLRIDVDKKPGSLPPNYHSAVYGATNYSIPPDNPFITYTSFNGSAVSSNSIRTEFFCIGLRNPYRMSFDDLTGYLYLGDVGQGTREEVDIIGSGGNYGWKFREGFIANGAVGAPPAGFNPIDPIVDYGRGSATNQGRTVIGGIVYRGDNFPELYGQYIFSDFYSGNIWSLTPNGTNATSFGYLTSDSSISAYGTDPRNGDVLMADISSGQIRKLSISTSSGTFPQTLADTGLFDDLEALSPAAGVEHYSINVPFWSDNAIKKRWFSVPSTNLFVSFDAELPWTFPTSMVWVKHFDLELTNGVASSARRIETRVLVKNVGGDGGYGVTYRWGNSTTNATLVPDGGLDEPIVINDSGIIRTQMWRYPSRSECIECHTVSAGFALSFNTPQVNRDHVYTGDTTNQLRALERAGYFDSAVGSVNLLRKVNPASDNSVSVEHRVRSYLQANCSQCHFPGGPTTAGFDTRLFTSISDANIIDGFLSDNFGDPTNRVIARGDTAHSMILSRISVRGDDQMPPLGSNLLDTQGIALVTAWITGEAAAYETFEEWQLRNFRSTVSADSQPGSDPDGDGGNNEYEYLTRTQPTNGADIVAFSVDTDSMPPALSYQKSAGVGFDVQVATNLIDGDWMSLDVPENAPVFEAADVPFSVPDPEGTNLTERFYRMKVYEP